MFTTEQEMSIQFERFLQLNFGNSYIKECQGLFGVPDFIFYAKEGNTQAIISFELKLHNWKRAAQQAFRYKSFSNMAYVVLPNKNAKAAIKNISFFEQYKIGLAVFDAENSFNILYKPELSIPYSDNLNEKLIQKIGLGFKKNRRIVSLI